jgi:hypothetical protein
MKPIKNIPIAAIFIFSLSFSFAQNTEKLTSEKVDFNGFFRVK